MFVCVDQVFHRHDDDAIDVRRAAQLVAVRDVFKVDDAVEHDVPRLESVLDRLFDDSHAVQFSKRVEHIEELEARSSRALGYHFVRCHECEDVGLQVN